MHARQHVNVLARTHQFSNGQVLNEILAVLRGKPSNVTLTASTESYKQRVSVELYNRAQTDGFKLLNLMHLTHQPAFYGSHNCITVTNTPSILQNCTTKLPTFARV